MSGWPWMKNEQVAIADTCIDDADDEFEERRPSVKELISQNRLLIDDVKSELCNHELYDETKHDDLWILRFLLSHKKDKRRALAAAEATLVYRKIHSLDERDVRAFPPQHRDQILNNESFHRLFEEGIGEDSITVVVPDKKRCGVVIYFNVSSIDTHALANVEQEDWLRGMTYVNEFQFQWLDYLTRTTGRLTKSTHIVDVAGIYFSMFNMTTQRKYTSATRAMQDCYPQAVQAYLVCHAPVWIEGPWRYLKPLLPSRVVEKLDFLNPRQYDEDLKRLLQYVPKALLPERFGGENQPWPPAFMPPLD